MDREKVIGNIKTWIDIDEEMKVLRKEMKTLRDKKKELTKNLVEVMKSNEIDCFDIKDGQLIYTKNKTKKALSKKHLISSLLQYFSNDQKTAKDISAFVLNSREDSIKESIRRKIKK